MPPEDNININAAKEYVQSAEQKIEPAARDALNELKGALDASSQTHTKEALMKLAQAVDVAQKNEKKEFVLTEFEKRITLLTQRVESIDIPRNATAEYIVEKVYETGNETLIDGTELLLGTLNEHLSNLSLSPYERENIKIGILGYVFDHYYEVLGGLKISDLQNIFSDLTKSFSDLTQLTKKPTKDVGVVDSLTNKWNALSGLVSGGSDSLSKVTGLLDTSSTLEDKVQKNITGKFGPLIELLTKHRAGKDTPPEGDVLSGFLSDPENILNFDKRFPAQTGAELEQKIAGAPRAPQEKTSELAAKLKTVFENKTAILDKVTGTGKNILDTFADSTDTGGPLSWGRDIALGVLKFLGNLPFIGNFIKGLLGIDANADMETYFGDEKRFQRLSAKSLRSLSEEQNSILTGKNLINVTTKRIAPFTKAYFGVINSNKDAKPEEKIMSMDPKMWLSIIDKHEIPLPTGNKLIENTKLHIGASDFDAYGKPVKSFFEKINGLENIISGASAATSIKPGSGKAPEKVNTEGKKPERPLIEGKTKKEIADIIFQEGNGLISEYRASVEKMANQAEKDFVTTQLGLISGALETRDVAKIKLSLATINSENISKKLTPEQRETLIYFNSLIKAWEEKKDEPEATEQKTKHEEAVPPKKEAGSQTLREKVVSGAKDIANTGLDWLKSKIN